MSTNPFPKTPSVNTLIENERKTFMDVSDILLKFASNILNDPGNPKYRRIRVANPIVESRLLPVCGAVECLFDMGFEEDGEFFVLPETTSLDGIRQVKDELLQVRENFQQQTSRGGVSVDNAQNTPAAATVFAQQNAPATLNRMHISEAKFFQRIKSHYEHILLYEDPALQLKARSCMPLDQLKQKAEEKYRIVSSEASWKKDAGMEDFLLVEMIAWFKYDFFKWMNSPSCESCGGTTKNAGHAEPKPAEKVWGAGQVENYKCDSCGCYTRFPRYNHPGKLLETRVGRCGEWGNCFTLCCRAVGFEARYIMDFTDHVWTEVFSQVQKKWLHCDPSENICDQPLIYEAGWNKKLSYIIAFSKDEVRDVTWRYTSKPSYVLAQRNLCRESWLLNMTIKLSRNLQDSLSQSRKKELENRFIKELATCTHVKDKEAPKMGGRISGSLAWRQSRGETGITAGSTKSTIVHPTSEERQLKMVHLKYNCALNKYHRISYNGEETSGWETYIYSTENIHRKEELDWKMAYLARQEGTDIGKIAWKFDFTDCGLVVKKIEILAVSTSYQSGQVSWRICGDNQCVRLPSDGNKTEVDELSGCKSVTLTAELKGGDGDIAWQHTQLFRQQMEDTKNWPLEVKIHLKEVA